jgi:hypothetical protein
VFETVFYCAGSGNNGDRSQGYGVLELIKLTLGFREATPELVYVACQAVALLVQLTEADGQPVDSPG